MMLRLWFVPLATLILVISGLVLFQFNRKYKTKITSSLNLLVGLGVLLYPSIALTFHLLNFFRIGVDMFSSGLIYSAAAFVVAIGLLGLLIPGKKREILEKTR